MIVGYRCVVSMFGMNDPNQTLMQLESYIRDGRLEMSEVMATQFTDMFLQNKKRSKQDQIMLIRGLQILCDVLVMRNKVALSTTSAKTLLRERKKISNQFRETINEKTRQTYVKKHQNKTVIDFGFNTEEIKKDFDFIYKKYFNKT